MKARIAAGLIAAGAVAVGMYAGAQSPARQPPLLAYFIVEFRGPIEESWKGALLASGAEILDYLPDFAYKVRLARSDQGALRALPGVVAVTIPSPAQKLTPGLVRDGTRAYLVTVERGADPGPAGAAIAMAGAQVVGREGSRLLIVADAGALEAIAAVDDIASIENLPLYEKHNEFGAGMLAGATVAHAAGFDGSTQMVAIADSGLGDGTASGAHPDVPASRIASIFNWPGAGSFCFETIVDDGAADVDSGHGTHVTTTALGDGGPDGAGRGAAPAARLVFQAVENWARVSSFCSLLYGLTDGYYLVGIPADIGTLFQQAYDAGARVHSDSWGSNAAGAYTTASAAADAFMWSRRDMTITLSAGNAGTDANNDGVVDGGSIASPATAKNVITVGASENDRHSQWGCDPALTYTDCAARGSQNALFTYGAAFPSRFKAAPLHDDSSAGNAGQMAAFSSRGPTVDGRIKPDVVAPGTWILSGYSGQFREQYDPAPNPVNGRYQHDGWGDPLNADYKYMGGTSMSAPLVAGAAAIVRDYYEKAHRHDASAALVKATLINSAVDLPDENNDGIDDNAFPIPNMHEGWGRIDLAAATRGSHLFLDEQSAVLTGDRVAFGIPVLPGGPPLKITLAWTDYPASASAARALVNDLDLRVTAPDGTTYAGNAFAGGWSVPGGASDRLNNLENVYVAVPTPGEWTVMVRAFNVPMGPQPFALVIDGAAGSPVPADPGPALPVVTIVADPATASEAGPESGVFHIARTGDTSAELQVRYAVSGTATPGEDYLPLDGSLVIPAGAASATLTVTPLDDEDFEPDETVIVTLAVDAAYEVGEPGTATVTVTSDDGPSDLVVSAVSAPSAAAAGGTMTLADTTKNQGSGSAAPSETGFYLSANTILDAADTFLGSRPVSRLAAGASEAFAVELPVPESTAAGTYYVIAKADWNDTVAESHEANNLRRSAAIRVGPDLVISAVSAPGSAAAGAIVAVQDTTVNQGAGSAGPSSTGFYLSANLSLDQSDVPLGRRAVPELAAGETHAASTALRIPESTPGGLYYLLAKADDEGDVAEANEANNVKASLAIRIGPDLVVTSVTAPPIAAAGSAIAVGDTTANRGEGAAPPSATGYYLTASSILKATDVLLARRDVPALEPGEAHAGQATLTVPPGTTPGTYFVVAKADADGELAEANEGNNTRATAIRVGPDLTVPSVVAPASGGAGRSMDIGGTVRNAGKDPAGATTARIYLSANVSLDSSDALLGSLEVPPLAGETSSQWSATVTVPEETPTGNHYLLVQVDPDNVVVEFNETNNIGRSAVIRIGPDLTVPAFSGPSGAPAGSAIVVTDTTANTGGGDAPPSMTSFYLSTNTTLDSSDILLGSRAVPGLEPGATHTASTTLTLPSALEAKTYYLIAVADGPGEVPETSETNNRRVISIRISGS
jgi:serine protease AprX